ncbi:hypothetical protein Tco_0636957 [Tanacetum coccineum]
MASRVNRDAVSTVCENENFIFDETFPALDSIRQTPLNNSETLFTVFNRGGRFLKFLLMLKLRGDAHPRRPSSVSLIWTGKVDWISLRLLVAGRGDARKGGSRVLIPDLVVMERVGASDVSSKQAHLLRWVIQLPLIGLMGSSAVIANQVALLPRWKKRSWRVMVHPIDHLGTGRTLRFYSIPLLHDSTDFPMREKWKNLNLDVSLVALSAQVEKFDCIRKLLPTVVRHLLQSHKYKQSLSEPFDLAIQTVWDKRLSVCHTEEGILATLANTEELLKLQPNPAPVNAPSGPTISTALVGPPAPST